MDFLLPAAHSRHFAESSCDHGDLHAVFHLLVEHSAEDDVGVVVCSALNDGAGLLHFRELQ